MAQWRNGVIFSIGGIRRRNTGVAGVINVGVAIGVSSVMAYLALNVNLNNESSVA